jgi:hypothetical protein
MQQVLLFWIFTLRNSFRYYILPFYWGKLVLFFKKVSLMKYKITQLKSDQSKQISHLTK